MESNRKHRSIFSFLERCRCFFYLLTNLIQIQFPFQMVLGQEVKEHCFGSSVYQKYREHGFERFHHGGEILHIVFFYENLEPSGVLKKKTSAEGHCSFQHVEDHRNEDKDDDAAQDSVFCDAS